MSIDNHFYYSDNGNPIIAFEIIDTPKVREVLKRLSEYEDIGLTPDVIKYKLDELEQLNADLKGKENDIAVLKWRVSYLSQFKPKEAPDYTIGIDFAEGEDFTGMR
jgi:hypothetical protein